MSITYSLPAAHSTALVKWQTHPFYTSAIVLGLDVGLEGIGVCVRRGSEILYAKTWLYDVPAAARLESRRQLRGARHCRANRKTRLRRLDALFRKHGLPAFGEPEPGAENAEQSARAWFTSDPYELRFRAIKETNAQGQATNPLASKVSLAIAIRHCVAHRGHDYEYFSDEGKYPWGESTEFDKVKKELLSVWLIEEEATKALRDSEDFDEWDDAQREEFRLLLKEHTKSEEIIAERLREHDKGGHNHLRISAKGESFSRKLVRAHLERITTRHEHMIADVASFSTALFRENKTTSDREHSIFFYHRKTRDEMIKHFEKKKARCNYAVWLGIADAKGKPPMVADGSDLDVRRFRLLEFAVTNKVEVVGHGRIPLAETEVRKLLDALDANPSATAKRDATPTIEWLIESIKQRHAIQPKTPRGKVTLPQIRTSKKGCPFNYEFFTHLRDLLAPSHANRRKNARMSSEAASHLYHLASAAPLNIDGFRASLANAAPEHRRRSYYDFRRAPQIDLSGVYPQVDFLLGQRVKKDVTHPKKRGEPKKIRGQRAFDGKLQRLFSVELREVLGGRVSPDYAVVEMPRDLPRNTKQKKEMDDRKKENGDRRKKLFEKHKVTDKGKGAERRRVELYDQQGGLCPFTGDPLGDNPLSAALDIEHLFPESKDGLSVDDNLVLTFKSTNADKSNRTPRQYAEKIGKPFEKMVAHTREMRWSNFKREVFAWDDPNKIPEFENTTRVAQLARQLRAEVADWMDIDDPDVAAERIGTPSGLQTSTCRYDWGFPKKDRAVLTHHLVDAVLLSYIPPGAGQNINGYGSIFFRDYRQEKGRTYLHALPLSSDIAPDVAEIERMIAADAAECPIYAHRSSSSSRALHDQSLLGIFECEKPQKRGKGAKAEVRTEKIRSLKYREQLDRESYIRKRNKARDPESLAAGIAQMGISEKLRPSRDALKRWLDGPPPSAGGKDDPAKEPKADPLRLNDGSLLRATYIDGKTEEFDTPFGFTARLDKYGQLQGIRIFKEKFDALEIWRHTDPKGRCVYVTQRRPAKAALRALLSLGFAWFRAASRTHGWPHKEHSAARTVTAALRTIRANGKHAWPNLTKVRKAKRIVRSLVELGFDAEGKSADVRWPEFHAAIWGAMLSPDARMMGARTLDAGKQGGAWRAAILQKGDLFRLPFNAAGEMDYAAKTPRYAWFCVAAIQANGQVKLLQATETPGKDEDGEALKRNALGIPFRCQPSDAAIFAIMLGLPTIPACDSSPHPTQRPPGPSRPGGEASFRLE